MVEGNEKAKTRAKSELCAKGFGLCETCTGHVFHAESGSGVCDQEIAEVLAQRSCDALMTLDNEQVINVLAIFVSAIK